MSQCSWRKPSRLTAPMCAEYLLKGFCSRHSAHTLFILMIGISKALFSARSEEGLRKNKKSSMDQKFLKGRVIIDLFCSLF